MKLIEFVEMFLGLFIVIPIIMAIGIIILFDFDIKRRKK